MSRDFKAFFKQSKFHLVAIGDSNWDYYAHEFEGKVNSIDALAKRNGASDCVFSGLKYFKQYIQSNPQIELTSYGRELLNL